MTMQIDAHQHFWNPARGDYGWMPADDAVLTRRYGPDHLRPALQSCGIDSTVLVQAAPSVAETEYMLGIADATPEVAGVVGWFDFERPDQAAEWDRLSQHPSLIGVRPMIQDIPDVAWMLGDNVAWAFDKLIALDLAFDALGFPRHLDPFLMLLKRYPTMRVVIDHGMKPQIHDSDPVAFTAWAEGMSRLADETGAFCKLSGLVTEASETWSAEALAPYVAHILEAFGPARVMWGSDWPVCRLRCEYEDWHDAAISLTRDVSPTERDMIFGQTAQKFYRLAPERSA
ncbi:MAG: amidohydrolase family protein [Pseudomonadota bacterium]